MTQAAKGQEPSMEEILASIRRIIADDDTAKSAAHADAPNGAEAAAPPRAALLTARMASPARPASLPEPVRQQEEIDKMLARLHAGSMRQASEAADEPPADILDASEESALEQAPGPAGIHAVDVPSDSERAASAVEPRPLPGPAPELRRAPGESGDRGLLSPATTAAVDTAFGTLARTVLVQNGRTLEDLVQEMLRPMLKTWLDSHLPSMVERLVRTEIERVSRGRA
jgi:cell pole-organizing protein PopZ